MARSPETKNACKNQVSACTLRTGVKISRGMINDFKCKDSLEIVTKIQYVVTGVWSKGKYEFEE